MKTLGLHFGEQITAVLLQEDGTWESFVAATEEDTAHLTDLALDAGSRIAATFATNLRTRMLSFPFTQPRKIHQVLPLQLEEHLPGASVDFEQHVHIGKDEDHGIALVHLISTNRIARVRDQLRDITPNTRTLEPDVLAMARRHTLDEHTVFIWVDADHTNVVAPGPLPGHPFYFSVPFGASRLEEPSAAANLLVRIQGMAEPSWQHWIIDGHASGVELLAELIEARFSNAQITRISETEPPSLRAARVAAEAHNQRIRPAWNLAPHRPLIPPELAKSGILQTIAIPMLVLLVFAALTTHSGNRALYAQAETYRREVNKIFTRNFPNSRAVRPLQQMQTIVERRAGSSSGGTQADKIIKGLAAFHSQISSTTRITISELRSSGGNWILRGEAPDFGGVDELKKSIETVSHFGDVQVQRAEQTVDKSAIRFSVSWNEKAL